MLYISLSCWIEGNWLYKLVTVHYSPKPFICITNRFYAKNILKNHTWSCIVEKSSCLGRKISRHSQFKFKLLCIIILSVSISLCQTWSLKYNSRKHNCACNPECWELLIPMFSIIMSLYESISLNIERQSVKAMTSVGFIFYLGSHVSFQMSVT